MHSEDSATADQRSMQSFLASLKRVRSFFCLNCTSLDLANSTKQFELIADHRLQARGHARAGGSDRKQLRASALIFAVALALLATDERCASISSLQDMYAPDPDPYLERTTFERTEEQKEELGLNDIRTENYT